MCHILCHTLGQIPSYAVCLCVRIFVLVLAVPVMCVHMSMHACVCMCERAAVCLCAFVCLYGCNMTSISIVTVGVCMHMLTYQTLIDYVDPRCGKL